MAPTGYQFTDGRGEPEQANLGIAVVCRLFKRELLIPKTIDTPHLAIAMIWHSLQTGAEAIFDNKETLHAGNDVG